MSIKNRLRKLEARSTVATVPLIAFHQIYGLKEGTEETSRIVESWPGPAKICGLGLGLIHPKDGETKTEFERRVYAIRAGGKLIEDMTKEERLAAFALADERLKDCGNGD